jgi:hypothetical protein
MKTKLLSEIQKLFPDFHPGWRGNPPDVILANLHFGTLLHGVVCDQVGTPLFDQPVWAEPAGAITVPLTAEGELGFVENYRPVVAASGGPYPPSTLDACGVVSLELPRGFPNPGETAEEAAMREAEEELGLEAASAEIIGRTNANTSYLLTDQKIIIVTLTGSKAIANRPDHGERIDRTRLLTIGEVVRAIASGDIFCGITKSALMTFFSSDQGQAAYRRFITGG